MAVDKAELLMLLRLNKQLIPEIASFRDAEAEINIRTQAREKAVTDEVNAREAAVAATAPGTVSASDSSTVAPTGIAASSGSKRFGSHGHVLGKCSRQDNST